MKPKKQGKLIYTDQLQGPDTNKIGEPYGIIDDTEAADRFGARNIIEYSYLAWRCCAVANLMTVLKTEELYSENLYRLSQELLQIDGYAYKNLRGQKDIGWKHRSLIEISNKYGLPMKSMKVNSSCRLIDILSKSRYVIVSVKGVDGGHMVILKEMDNNITQYIDPLLYKNSGGPNMKIKTDIFMQKFKKRILVVW